MATKKGEKHILDVLEKLIDISQNSQLDFDKMKDSKSLLNYCCKTLDINNIQAIFFALIVNFGSDESTTTTELAQHLGCRHIRVMRNLKEIEGLVEKGYIATTRPGCYRVPSYVINDLKENQRYVPKSKSGLTIRQLLSELDNIISLREDDEIDFESFYAELSRLMEANRHLHFADKILSIVQEDQKTWLPMLVYLCTEYIFYNNDLSLYDINEIYDKHSSKLVKHYLMLSFSPLQSKKIIENTFSDGFANRESYKLTETAKNELLKELDIKVIEDKNPNRLQHELIAAKKLFYNPKEELRVKQLSEILEQENFNKIIKNLESNNLRKGFTCLFYGAPGTGKTETVYQTARKTKRDIIQINIANIKSMWVGESEKNIKKFFDSYRTTVSKSEVAPILLFNEADAIITKRQAGAERAIDKMENSLQNIILQEMENLNGILIATSNLVENMDKAFERRFLYKIKFEKPETNIKEKIWKSMLPSATEEQITQIAKQYDFSGGQIENIARKITINNVLTNSTNIDQTILEQFCEDEFLDLRKNKKNVGF